MGKTLAERLDTALAYVAGLTQQRPCETALAILKDRRRLNETIQTLSNWSEGKNAENVDQLVEDLKDESFWLLMNELAPKVAERLYYRETPYGWETDLYADYRDKMSGGEAALVAQSACPEETLNQMLYDWYECQERDKKGSVSSAFRDLLLKHYSEEGVDLKMDDVDSYVEETFYVNYPEKHFLDQSFSCNITMDTGDGNYDFTLNCRYPSTGDVAFGGGDEARGPIDERASIVWLAKTQGYTAEQLRNALNEGDMSSPEGFLQSMRVELANTSTSALTVTFLVRLTLQQMIDINELIRQGSGSVRLRKDAETGLWDPWSGGGGPFEINLEKDVDIPAACIRSCMPDGQTAFNCREYSVSEVYGMCGSAWKDTLIKISQEETEEETNA